MRATPPGDIEIEPGALDTMADFLEAHPEHRAELEAFAASIAGAHFEGTRP